MIRKYRFPFEQLNITSADVEEVMGYERGKSPEPFPLVIEKAVLESNELCDIQGGIFLSELFSLDDNGFKLVDTKFFTGKKISDQLYKSSGAALFICTAGMKISERIHELTDKGEYLEAYIYDVIGSLTVEYAMNMIHDIFDKEMEVKGIGVTNRYSPGYCDWNLNEQKKLFSFFPESFCGVELSESYLMTPVKSVSGVIGFGSEAKRRMYECSLCNLSRCIYRKQRKAG